MSTISPFLKLTLQDLDENPDTWGTVLNVSALELLEDAIAGTAVVTLASTADYTMDDTAGGPTAADGARYAIVAVGGSPGGATNIIVPTRSKIYLVANSTGDASSIVVKTSAGTGVTVANGEVVWMYCDGTNVVAVSAGTATSAITATTATNALQLGGIAAANYGPLNVANTWTKGQVTQRVALTNVAGDITLNPATSNCFYHLTTGGFAVKVAGSPVNGAQMTLIVEQGTGAPHAGTFQSNTFIWDGGTPPTFSTVFGDVDYLGFEYVTLSGGGRWVGNIIKGVS